MSSVSLINGHIDDDDGMEVTDNEIIKALECCTGLDFGKCAHCHLIHTVGCSSKLLKYSFDLINRQKAEIERLKAYIKKCESGEEYWVKSLVKRPKETLEEFAEKVKAQTMLDNAFIDNLVKEMVGDGHE